MDKLSPWSVITLLGCASLVLIDAWREQGPTALPLLRGILPNLVAVPTLVFGFLMIRFPQREPFEPGLLESQTRWFWRLWWSALAVTVAWEFTQLSGALVFDPNDLIATALGAALSVLAYHLLARRAFLNTRLNDDAPKA